MQEKSTCDTDNVTGFEMEGTQPEASISTSESSSSVSSSKMIECNNAIQSDQTDANKPTTFVSTNNSLRNNDNEDSLSDYKYTKSSTTIRKTARTTTYTIRNQTSTFKHKWFKLLLHSEFCVRIMALILSLILLTLSIAYCIAQLLNVELDLLTECDPKTREEIWSHSALASIDGELSEESQYGYTTKPCWTTQQIQVNIDLLWFGNYYKTKRISDVNAKCILFGLVSIYCLCIIMFTIFQIITDIKYAQRNVLHTKSRKYDYYRDHKKNTAHKRETYSMAIICKAVRVWNKYLSVGTTTWIIIMFMGELIEIIIQTNALFYYTGNSLVGGNKSDLALKPEFIVLFTVFIGLNCIGVAIVWLLFSIAPHQCNGLVFRLSLFFVDQLADLFYAVFPFLVLLLDKYQNNSGDITVLLGQLEIISALAFCATFFPLLFLCNKCLLIVINSTRKMRDKYFKEWLFVYDVSTQKKNQNAVNIAKAHGFNVRLSALNVNMKEIYDENGKLALDYKTDSNIKDDATSVGGYRKALLITASLIYFVYGIMIIILITLEIKEVEYYCSSVKEDNYFINNTFMNVSIPIQEINVLKTNPELFLWDKCLYKVYNIFTYNKQMKCQCRVLYIDDWLHGLGSSASDRMRYFNLTQQKILSGMLEHWYMLEKFHLKETESFHINLQLTPSMMKGKFMKAFEWSHAKLEIHSQSIASWQLMEYLRIDNAVPDGFVNKIPNDFGELIKMKQLFLTRCGIREFSEEICKLRELQLLHLQRNTINSIPHCVDQLTSLKQLLVDATYALINVPLSMFALPNLIDLSVYSGSISYQDLLKYNLPNWVNINDTDAINTWFDANFSYHKSAHYFLQSNKICEENISSFPKKLQLFMNSTKSCESFCVFDSLRSDGAGDKQNCLPILLGNGRCDHDCNLAECAFDLGDCVQMCFDNEYSHCTWDLFTNTQCDDECANEYCVGWKRGSNFKTPYTVNIGREYTADLFYCHLNETQLESSVFKKDDNHDACLKSKSEYVDNYHNLEQGHFNTQCQWFWVGNGICEDVCRTDECLNDGGDCKLQCDDNECSEIYLSWQYLMAVNGMSGHIFSIDTICTEWWPYAVDLLEIDEQNGWIECYRVLQERDYNEDGYINFREYTAAAFFIFEQGRVPSNQGQFMNCSTCVGTEYYNIKYD